MASSFVVRRNQYYDSAFLMGVSRRISEAPGIRQNAVLMGSDANKGLLSAIGIHGLEVDLAGPNDLVVAVIADAPEIVAEVLGRLDEYLMGGVQAAATSNPHSLEAGLAQRPDATLAVISVPGEYAAREAGRALDAGLSVFLFSDNVSIEDELRLKRMAAEKRLLLMGPDCGTSLIGGVGIGFANAVRRGAIGAIGAAGTGLQEFTSQIHNAGLGISHAIGTGGHDLSDPIGGLTTFAALNALEADPHTQVITVISKPPGAQTLAQLTERFKTCSKPVIGCFLGTRPESGNNSVTFRRADNIDDAARLAIQLAGGGSPLPEAVPAPEESERAERERAAWNPAQKYVRGLFAGGTFCYQSQQIFRDAGIPVRSNAPLEANSKLEDAHCSIEHSFVDMGADEFTVGRPHPMIDGTLRRQRILEEARDPQVAVLLLDFILGYNASMDPVGELLDAILEARQAAQQRGGHLTVVASVCGTEGDPQELGLQIKLMERAGAVVFRTNARAAAFCCSLFNARGG